MPIPHKQVDEDGDGEEDTPDGKNVAEEQHEVAQEAEHGLKPCAAGRSGRG